MQRLPEGAANAVHKFTPYTHLATMIKVTRSLPILPHHNEAQHRLPFMHMAAGTKVCTSAEALQPDADATTLEETLDIGMAMSVPGMYANHVGVCWGHERMVWRLTWTFDI